jgi:hypothetical protein
MRKQHLIKHPPSRSMSERGEVRILTKQLRKLENTEPTPENVNLMLRLSQRIGKLRASINRRGGDSPVKRPVGRPKTVKPVEPEVVVNETLEAVLEMEKQRRETPEPSVVFEHAKRAEVKAEIKKEREAAENRPIADTQRDVTVASPVLLDMLKAVNRQLADDEVMVSVGMTNTLLTVYDREPEPPAEPVESGYLAEWNWVPKKW